MNVLSKSELVIAKILERLIENGLRESELNFKDLGLPEEFGNFFFQCVDWFRAEGFIRYTNLQRFVDSTASGYVLNPVLTSLGMHMLGNTVEIGQKSVSVAEAVSKVISGKVDYNRVGNAIGGILGGFTKSIGS